MSDFQVIWHGASWRTDRPLSDLPLVDGTWAGEGAGHKCGSVSDPLRRVLERGRPWTAQDLAVLLGAKETAIRQALWRFQQKGWIQVIAGSPKRYQVVR